MHRRAAQHDIGVAVDLGMIFTPFSSGVYGSREHHAVSTSVQQEHPGKSK